MSSLYPLTFHPIFKERVWGGRRLEQLYGKPLPPNIPVGESWEITDRPEGISQIANGPLAGQTLRWLMEHHAAELLGRSHDGTAPFPLLVKMLDAREKLSLQVHPPAAAAKELGGEPKTELWLLAETQPGAELYVGLKRGTTRAEFERRIQDGTVADCVHRAAVQTGDVMFLPSGRLHAIGAGNVIFEIQQNSDTTYRVFDWNRTGLDGKARELHVPQSLASIDFNDFEPSLVQSAFSRSEEISIRYLVDDPLFRVNQWRVRRGQRFHLKSNSPQIIGLINGALTFGCEGMEVSLRAGGFVLLPAILGRVVVTAPRRAEFLHVEF